MPTPRRPSRETRRKLRPSRDVFGSTVPVSSLKGYIGHTLGASGAIELAASLSMMEQGVIYPTLNLDTVSPECEGIHHVMQPLKKQINDYSEERVRLWRHQRGAGVQENIGGKS